MSSERDNDENNIDSQENTQYMVDDVDHVSERDRYTQGTNYNASLQASDDDYELVEEKPKKFLGLMPILNEASYTNVATILFY